MANIKDANINYDESQGRVRWISVIGMTEAESIVYAEALAGMTADHADREGECWVVCFEPED